MSTKTMGRRDLPSTQTGSLAAMAQKLESEIQALYHSIGLRLKGNAAPYDTAKQAEQMARRLGRLDSIRTMMQQERTK
jgi:hypothetical protein